MNFGNILHSLICITNQKNSTIANLLGYDVSYISKWLNCSKLPSAKNIDTIVVKLCDLFILDCSEDILYKICQEFDFDDCYEYDNLHEFRKGIYVELKLLFNKAYKNQKLNENSSIDNTVIPNTASFISNKELKFHLIETLRSYSNKSSSNHVSVIITSDMDNYTEKSSVETIIREKINIFKDKKLNIVQVINLDSISHDVNKYCRLIILYLNNESGINLSLLKSTKKLHSDTIIVKNCLSLTTIHDDVTDMDFNYFTKDLGLVNNLFAHYVRALKDFPLLFNVSDLSDVNTQSHCMNYLIQPSFKYLLNEIPLFFLSENILDDFKSKDISDLFPREFNHMIYNKTYPCDISILMFKSSLLDYILNGNINFKGTKIHVHSSYRINHIKSLINMINKYPDFNLKLLEDDNPIISKHDFRNNLFLSPNVGFFTKSNDDNPLFYKIFDSQMRNQFIRFFDNLWNDCTSTKSDTIILLEKSLQLLMFNIN